MEIRTDADVEVGGGRVGETMRFAVVGCAHGELDAIYATVEESERTSGKKVDAVLCCGDFQAVRNLDDLQCMAVPDKYKRMNSFYRYYSGEKKAKWLTIFVGGNHEAINHLWELYYGGWVAENIYFLGFAGVVNLGGLRIAGLSGIYHDRDYKMGHFEFQDQQLQRGLRSSYHVRQTEVFRLLQIKQPVDIFLSHDWPRRVQDHGNREQLLQKKPFFRRDMETGRLGNPALEDILHTLKPAHWFAAHLHVKFAAVVRHPSNGTCDHHTKFLALDKPIPGRDFMQIFEIPTTEDATLKYDAEWLPILCTFHAQLNLHRRPLPVPQVDAECERSLACNLTRTHEILQKNGKEIPLNFVPTAPVYEHESRTRRGAVPASIRRSPQTVQFLSLLGLEYNLPLDRRERDFRNPEEIDLGEDDGAAAANDGQPQACNPEEIDLGSEEEDV